MKKILLALSLFSTNVFASPVQGTLYYSGNLSCGRSEAFAFEVKPKQKFIIAARAEGKGNLDCFLFDAQDKLVAEYKDSTNTCLLEISPKSLNYKIVVINNGSIAQPYEITIQ